MRAVIQRVSSASVRVEGKVVGAIERPGLVVLLGVTHADSPDDAVALAAKTWGLRILHGERSASDLAAPLLVISQFTLYADVRKGRRPSWGDAAPAPVSEPLYQEYCRALHELGAHVERGVFGADMAVEMINDGPVTLILDSAEMRRR